MVLMREVFPLPTFPITYTNSPFSIVNSKFGQNQVILDKNRDIMKFNDVVKSHERAILDINLSFFILIIHCYKYQSSEANNKIFN